MKIIFLDRDGVINNYPGYGNYVTSWREFSFLPGVLEALKNLTRGGFDTYIISNQAGIAKGIYSKQALDDITNRMLKVIEKGSGKIKGVFYCIHQDKDNCNCRKPKIGLIQKALGKSLNPKNSKLASPGLNQSYLIGDSLRDIRTGKNAGCRTILVLSGQESLSNKSHWQVHPDFIAKDLLEASRLILKHPNR